MADQPKLIWKKLSRAWGYADDAKNTIWLDPRQDDAALLNSGIHERLHLSAKYLDESEVTRIAHELAAFVFRLGFRRVNEGDE